MFIQTFHLFNSFSLPWTLTGGLRDPWVCFWHRLSFLNTEALSVRSQGHLGMDRPSFLNGPSDIRAGPESQQMGNTLPFFLHLVESTKLHPGEKATLSTLSCLYIPACTLTTRILSGKDAFEHFFLLTCLTFQP